MSPLHCGVMEWYCDIKISTIGLQLGSCGFTSGFIWFLIAFLIQSILAWNIVMEYLILIYL